MALADMLDDMVRDKCGVFGVFGHARAAELTYLGLYALQHRGQESAGIVAAQNGKFNLHKGMGEVSEVFSDRLNVSKLSGSLAIGHTRYSTTGASSLLNIQPFMITNRSRNLAIVHNGNLTNSLELKKKLDAAGSIFQ
ncbi:MAG: class II glutamine amidotransferase, partial [Proteobacteria bacterium]|nr:class II glutamine amidotransferase [Pseudomonadota bacterium]